QRSYPIGSGRIAKFVPNHKHAGKVRRFSRTRPFHRDQKIQGSYKVKRTKRRETAQASSGDMAAGFALRTLFGTFWLSDCGWLTGKYQSCILVTKAYECCCERKHRSLGVCNAGLRCFLSVGA